VSGGMRSRRLFGLSSTSSQKRTDFVSNRVGFDSPLPHLPRMGQLVEMEPAEKATWQNPISRRGFLPIRSLAFSICS